MYQQLLGSATKQFRLKTQLLVGELGEFQEIKHAFYMFLL